ncbi:MAG: preprotein translocase subunit SecA [Solirubrobacterales bacterium]|nr:preprotein translocase subunit SecA [Solirubrobacterales bacterium]MCB8971433.1 preprotein translocase subunit SecA [Thermoleophilales bacterium]MCO5327509.1 preprotein translocase subunit SecA [Solirubrobacterales bacterium]
MARGLIDKALRLGESRQFKEYEKRVAEINRFEPEMELLEDHEIREEADELRERARDGESLDDLLPQAFALCREAGKRTLGQRHYDVQLIGGMVLHSGGIAEMKTGEGKTLTGTLAVFLNTLAGDSVHVVTVNDYLARRDAEWMKPLYDMLGVTVGVLQDNDLPEHGDRRHAAYAADVTFGTNSEFGFDHLRDNMAPSLERCFQRGHPFAIVDEVDNILIDEARTPLIISGSPEAAADLYYTFARLAKSLEGVEAKPKLKALGESKDTSEAEYDYEYDEKHKTVAPTERGVEKAEKFLGVENLYLSEHGTLVNHLIQSLKAESLYKRDKDYAVVDGEVMIIDEFTGRILEGRRWSEGLHQAVEAKEGVAIREENQTLATITLQNYFRLYEKLSGMTGTALTEATEFMKIYEIPVVEIPTNRDMVRDDMNDQIYKTKEGKWRAVVNEIAERHETGQPILIGTVSVETSEMLSQQFKKRGIKHEVLNAKPEYAQREGETVAQAGRLGAVTIATNMAGRGVDIKLGGDPEMLAEGELRKLGVRPGDENYDEELAALMPGLGERCKAEGEKVREAGGLFICGTERHESRRIDNQLRGRAGRQGDPGASRFFLSAQDDLVRLFAGDRIYKILDRLGPVDEDGEEYPLEAKMLSKQIESAQKKVEEQNYLSRKRVLEYDDVMNEQRRVVYKYRREVLEGRDMGDVAREQLEGVISSKVLEYTASDVFEEWDLGGLETYLNTLWPVSVDLTELDAHTSSREQVTELLVEDALAAYDEREEEFGEELMRALERHILLQIIDTRWKEHLHEMDYLREGIHLRGFAQIDPLVAYKNEGYSMFEALMEAIWEEFARLIFHVNVELQPAEVEEAFAPEEEDVDVSYSGGTEEEQPSALAEARAAAAAGGAATATAAPAVAAAGNGSGGTNATTVVKGEDEKIGRNDPCWCGSGKKYKKCHGS